MKDMGVVPTASSAAHTLFHDTYYGKKVHWVLWVPFISMTDAQVIGEN